MSARPSRTVHQNEDHWIFPRIWAGFLILFLIVTAPIWFPATDSPAVPMLAAARVLPVWLASVLSSILVIVLTAAALMTRGRATWFLATILLTLLFLLDQQRLQPWAYQSSIYGLVFASMNRTIATRWLVPMAASIYIYSAWGKFDYQFVHTVGVDFLGTIAKPFGGLPETMEIGTKSKLALLFPAGELAIGILLIPRTTRRAAGLLAIGLHLALLAILGPWGLNHSAGVLIWNVLLILQACFLFVWKWPNDNDTSPANQRGRMWPAKIAIMIAVAMPLSERSGYWDHWPSWALYSPHSSRMKVWIHPGAIPLLPESMGKYVSETGDDGWHELELDRWSLETRRTPIYPQARYQLGLALAIAESSHLKDQIRGRLRGPSDRRTGRREEKWLFGRTEMRAATKQYWLLGE